MAGKRVNSLYCTRICKAAASEQRRPIRDDAARYLNERDYRITAALAYAKKHPHVGQAAKRRRKAQQRQAGVFKITGKEWRRLCERYRWTCCYCGRETKSLSMDHVFPLARGGRHSIGNILQACMSCNASKSSHLLIEWRCRPRGEVSPPSLGSPRPPALYPLLGTTSSTGSLSI